VGHQKSNSMADNRCAQAGCHSKKGSKKKYCNKCHAKLQKSSNPVGYTYNLLKQNAVRRGVPFSLSLSDFRKFCDESGYLNSKGRTKECSSIDRIIPELGYRIDNIQILTVSNNSIKRWTDMMGTGDEDAF